MEFNPQKQLAGLLEWMDQQMTQCGGKPPSSAFPAARTAAPWRRWLWPPMAGRTCTAC